MNEKPLERDQALHQTLVETIHVTRKPVALQPIKERAGLIAAMCKPLSISRLREAFAWANTDRDALIAEVEALRAMLGNLLEAPTCDVCYEDDFVDHDCSCGCHLMRADLERQARALLGKE